MARNVVTVLFGNNQVLILNSDCAAVNLLQTLKRKLGLLEEEDLVLDLADLNGNVLHLQRNLKAPVNDFLSDANYFFAVRKQPQPASNDETSNEKTRARLVKFVPLLNDCSRFVPNYQVPPVINADPNKHIPPRKRNTDTTAQTPEPTAKKTDIKKTVTIKA